MDGVSVAGFDWDDGNREKCAKHGLSIEEIESIFAAEPSVGPDSFDAATETRFRAIGRARSGRHVFVVFTLRRSGATPTFARSARATCIRRKCDIMSESKANKPLPAFASDAEAEAFVETADLTEFDLSDLKPVRFEFAAKGARVNMRLPEGLLAAVKASAEREGIPYQRFIRQALETAVSAR